MYKGSKNVRLCGFHIHRKTLQKHRKCLESHKYKEEVPLMFPFWGHKRNNRYLSLSKRLC